MPKDGYYLNGDPVTAPSGQPPAPVARCHCAEVDDDTLYTDDGRTWTPEEIRAACPQHGGQPAPEQGPMSRAVEPRAQVDMAFTRHEQTKKGIAKYGTPLMTFNGRSMYQDAKAELVDLDRYLTGLEMERDALAALLRRAYPLLMWGAPGPVPVERLCRDIEQTGVVDASQADS